MSEETNSLGLANDEQTGVVDQSEKSLNGYEDETGEEQAGVVDPEETEEAEETATQPQTREDNHAAAAARRKAEREKKAEIAKAKEEAHNEIIGRLRSSGVNNPYTNKPFESMEEFEAYGQKMKEAEQRERAENEGKTIEEIQREDADKAYIERKRREDSEKAEREKNEQAIKDRVSQDIDEFGELYPDVDVSKVVTNESFKRFAGSRLGKEPLTELYRDFTELVGTAEANGRAKAHSNRSTGSGDTGGGRMTAEQRRALQEWNSAYPDMKMTAAEFLGRN